MSQTYAYPFDPTGSLTSNVIPNERHVLAAVAEREFNFIVPTFAPFFRNHLRIRHLALGRDLVEGVDYHLTHWFHAASHGVGRPIYGSITFLDRQLTGTVELRYQTLGGDWVYDINTVLELMANRLVNPRITTWEQVVNLPFQFPVIDHQWNLDDLTGATAIVEKLNAITEAISAINVTISQSHVSDFENPHFTNKQHIGLGQVDNFATATPNEAREGVSNILFMTPFTSKLLIQDTVRGEIESHSNREDNPHRVTAAQLGAPTTDELIEILQGYLPREATARDAERINGYSFNELLEHSSGSVVAAPTLQTDGFQSTFGSTQGWTKLFETTRNRFSLFLTISNPATGADAETSWLNFVDVGSGIVHLSRYFIDNRRYVHEVFVKKLNNTYSLWVKHHVDTLGPIHGIVSGTAELSEIVTVVEHHENEPLWSSLDPSYNPDIHSCGESTEVLVTQRGVEALLEQRLTEFAIEMRAEALESIAP